MVFLWNVARRDKEEPFVCAIYNFDQFFPNEEVTRFWKRARFLSQVLVQCTQYPSLCSFTRALLSTSAISGLCASSFQQFILLCPSWQKVKDLFENKKSKLSSFGGNVLQGVLRILALRKRILRKNKCPTIMVGFWLKDLYCGKLFEKSNYASEKNHRPWITGFSVM